MNPFYQKIYKVVENIPYGKVVSYGKIASALGRPRASREVGRAMRVCPAENIPWQRVVMADGSIAGGGWANERKTMLEKEGVEFLSDGRVDMKKSCIDTAELEFLAVIADNEIREDL